MDIADFKNRLSLALKAITDLFANIPTVTQTLVCASGNKPMHFQPARPVSTCAIADTDAEVTSLQSSEVRFIDSRDTVLWENPGTGWVSRQYVGDESFLRPHTLVRSPWSGRVYYCDGFMRLTRANLTTSPTPS